MRLFVPHAARVCAAGKAIPISLFSPYTLMDELRKMIEDFNRQTIEDANAWRKDYYPHLKRENKEMTEEIRKEKSEGELLAIRFVKPVATLYHTAYMDYTSQIILQIQREHTQVAGGFGLLLKEQFDSHVDATLIRILFRDETSIYLEEFEIYIYEQDVIYNRLRQVDERVINKQNEIEAVNVSLDRL